MTEQKSEKKRPEFFYLAPVKFKRAAFTVRNSRFIATLVPSASEALAREALAAVMDEFSDATHHAYVYRIGSGRNLIERFSDAREPAGTAGLPMLQILQGRNVSDAIVIGTRYFGGTKLGIGGLTRAYRSCVRLSLEEAKLAEKEPLIKYLLKCSYEDFGPAKKLIDTYKGSIISADYGKEVDITVIIPVGVSGSFLAGLKRACRGRALCRQLNPLR